MRMLYRMYLPIILVLLITFIAPGQEKPMKEWSEREYNEWAREFYRHRQAGWSFNKTDMTIPPGVSGAIYRKTEGIMQGNRLVARIANFGSIGAPRRFPSVVWPKGTGRSVGYEFGPIVGAEVTDRNGNTIRIISDALIDGGERQNPNNPTGNVMGWEPLPGFAADRPNESVAISTRPETWPISWQEEGWPGRRGTGIITADEEFYYVMDDRWNDEFEYYPLQNEADSVRGLGIILSVRGYQFAAGPAQDILFLLYELTLREDAKPLDKVAVGMVGDPHMGGPANFADDYYGFDRGRNMVYTYDKPGSTNDYGVPWSEIGYLGFMFIQPPGADEREWLPLTSFRAPIYASVTAAQDERMWEMLIPNLGPDDPDPFIQQESDNLLIFGSGYFSLEPGETQKFAIAILCGFDLQHLQQNSDVALRIAELDFQFARPPEPPTVYGVPGDKKVTIYWDGTRSENSIDPFTGVKDFEGYRIYRSEDGGVTWGKPITDNRGNQVMWEPLAIFDIDNEWSGTHPVESAPGIHFYLGDNSGLEYTFVDSSLSLRNGVRYHYAVTAFDHGDTNLAPLENALNIDAINVVEITPTAPPLGFQRAAVDSLEHTSGSATGKFQLNALDPFVLKDETYRVTFHSDPEKHFIITTVAGDTVISNSGTVRNFQINGERNYIFDGLELEVDDENAILLLPSETRWTEGSSNLRLTIERLSGFATDAGRYEIHFSDNFIDNSVAAFGSQSKPIRFTVRDVSRDNAHVPVVFIRDAGEQDRIDHDDRILLLQDDTPPINVGKVLWQITFRNPEDSNVTPVNPGAGDVVQFSSTIPFNSTKQDIFTIRTNSSYIEPQQVTATMLDDIKVVPNPYLAASQFELPTEFRTGRGERVIKFINLPVTCTIRIYNVAGEHVITLDHAGSLSGGSERSWNLLNKDGLDVAPGLYIFHVDAPGIGETIGRFAIIK
jgi:hypothetical protein